MADSTVFRRTTQGGATSLSIASMRGHTELIKALVLAGADTSHTKVVRNRTSSCRSVVMVPVLVPGACFLK
jgi:hypothetical protein